MTSPYNLRYLTNFTGTTGLAMITLDKAFCNGFFVIRNKARNKQLVLLSLKKHRTYFFDEVADLAERLQLDNLAF